ncbi:MAG: NEW3 domain-containing protein [Mangrovibacterium sp.]
MTVRNFFSLQSALLLGFILISFSAFSKSGDLTLYTPYTRISVSPGQSVDYTIEMINNSDSLRNEEIRVSGIPRSWTYSLKSGSYTISKLAVLPNEKKTLTLKVEVPYQVNKGNYSFRVLALHTTSLPLVITVSEKGSSETEFTTDQANMQGNSRATFTYKASLKNRTAETQRYALKAYAPRGWTATVKADYKAVTSVEMEPNTSKDITIEMKPMSQVKAGTYKIPVRAVTGSTSADLELEAVVTGSYELVLSTPSGLVSTKLTAGSKKKLPLVIRNTGSAALTGIELKASAPAKWEVAFDPAQIDKLEAGAEATAYATIQADNKAIPGDYIASLEAKTPEANSKLSFRIMVKTPMIWGWIGVLIILAALGSVLFLFRKYGRR